MAKKEFYVPYVEGSLGTKTKVTLKRFVWICLGFTIAGAFLFSFFQKPFKNSTFELTNTTNITGTFHQSPYPMLRVKVAEGTYKNIVLLGFGKSSANPYLDKLLAQEKDLHGKTLSISGNLIYYNGKTLLQITDAEKVKLENQNGKVPKKEFMGEMVFEGEIIDPKCYFGVMKPGFGKIHRSCAVRCISGGIPPVLATRDKNSIAEYYLLTDLQGNPINDEVLSFIGKPSEIKGIVDKLEDWYILKIDPKNILILNNNSSIY